MRFSPVFIFVLMGVWAARTGHAQQAVLFQSSDAAGAFTLLPAGTDSGTPLFQSVDAPNGPVSVGGVRGSVQGQGLANRFDVAVGFDYLLPLWSYRDFLLAVPVGFEQFFPALGDTGHVDNHFAFAPRINLNYYVADADLTVGASGKFVNLSGRLQREATTTGGDTGKLVADSNLTLVSANLVEVTRRYAFLDLFPRKETAKQDVIDSLIDLSIGTRYSSVSQNFTGTLTGGVNGASVSTRHATQSFSGIGLTAAAGWTVPCGDDFTVSAFSRGSILVGENNRSSAVSVNVTGLPGFAESLTDSRTSFIPILESELGVEWGRDLAERLRNGEEPPRFTLRVAFVTQYWGDLGPLSAASTQGFASSDLFLLGVNILAGLRY